MINPLAKYVLICLCSVLPILGVAQLFNPQQLDFKSTPGSTVTIEIDSWSTPKFTMNPDPSIFSVDLGIRSGSSYPIDLTLINEDFTGEVSFSIQYEGGIKRRTKKYYTTVVFTIVDSHVEAIHDYKSIEFGDAEVVIDVLANDINSAKELSIQSVDLVENGTVVLEDNMVVFTPVDDFKGMAYINYTAINEDGITDAGTVSICVLDSENTPSDGTISISTAQYKPVTVLLPANGMSIAADSEPQGSINMIGDDVFEYTPFGSFIGFDEFIMENADNSIQRTVSVHVLESKEQFGPVKNDVFYTAINTPITFNVFDNDLEETEFVRIPKGLDYLGDGEFSFTPQDDYAGYVTFNYVSFIDDQYYAGQIDIHINNFYPENISTYQLVARQSTPLLINYSVPISDYSFTIEQDPQHGQVINYGSYYKHQIGGDECEWIERGVQILRYKSEDDFLGVDQFMIQYCAQNGECEDILVEVEVIQEDADCNCAGSDCVWPGDFNADGKVAMDDLLPLGYHFGEVGVQRDELSDIWIGDYAPDWGESQMNGRDLKFLDATGDGKIDLSELDALSDNYNKYHNLVASENLSSKEYPVELLISQTTAAAGDYLYIDVIIGDEDYPALNIHGLTYTLPLSTSVIDNSTINVERIPGNWLSHNSPMLDLFKQPSSGKVDIGSTRTTGKSVSGYGGIHRVGFIVIDDLDGIRGDNKNKTVNIVLDDITIADGQGNRFKVSGASTSFELIREQPLDETVLSEADIQFYPNPATDQLNIHANGNDILEQIDIFNLAGQLVSTATVKNENHKVIDLSHFQDGLYLIKVISFKGSSTTKFKVVK